MANNNPDPQILAQLMQMYQNGQITLPNQNNQNMNQFMNNNQSGNDQNTVFIPPNQNQFNNNMYNNGMNLMNFVSPNNFNVALNNNMNMNNMNNNFNMNNMNNNFNMNNMNNNFNMNNMNNNVNMNNMNNNMNMNMNMNQSANWTLIFEKKPENTRLNIQIASSEKVATAFKKCREKLMLQDTPLKFTFKNKPLNSDLTLSESGLTDGSTITVQIGTQQQPKPQLIQPQNKFQNQVQSSNSDQWNLLFEDQVTNSIFNIQVKPNQLFKEAVVHYKGKILKDITAIYIFNTKTLDENKTVREQGITAGAKILVVETSMLKGAL